MQWKTPPGVTFSWDTEVLPGSSQHQKIIVIDGCLAFSGGLDLTIRRWDTSKHEIVNRWRADPAGNAYRPFHDVLVSMKCWPLAAPPSAAASRSASRPRAWQPTM